VPDHAARRHHHECRGITGSTAPHSAFRLRERRCRVHERGQAGEEALRKPVSRDLLRGGAARRVRRHAGHASASARAAESIIRISVLIFGRGAAVRRRDRARDADFRGGPACMQKQGA
jgi:hypothetical protein